MASEGIVGKTFAEAFKDFCGFEVFLMCHLFHGLPFKCCILVASFATGQKGFGFGFVCGSFLEKVGAESRHGGGKEFGIRMLVGQFDVFLRGDVRFLKCFVNGSNLELGFGGEEGVRVGAGHIHEAGEGGAETGVLGLGIRR